MSNIRIVYVNKLYVYVYIVIMPEISGFLDTEVFLHIFLHIYIDYILIIIIKLNS